MHSDSGEDARVLSMVLPTPPPFTCKLAVILQCLCIYGQCVVSMCGRYVWSVCVWSVKVCGQYVRGQQTASEGRHQNTCWDDCAVTRCAQSQDHLTAVFSESAPVHNAEATDDNLSQNITEVSTLVTVKPFNSATMHKRLLQNPSVILLFLTENYTLYTRVENQKKV